MYTIFFVTSNIGMSSKDEKEAEITIPNNLRTVIRRPDRSSTMTSYGTRNLFKGKKLNTVTNNYDLISSKENEEETNPQLLALRNKTAKSKNRPFRPSTTVPNNQAHSLLSRPTTTMKATNPLSSIQRVQKQIEQDRLSISFQEDPIAYFAKRKDGGGHRFIYLNYTGNKNAPDFNPYDLTKVPFAEINDEYFTMSVTGVTRIQPDGNTKQVSMDRWAKESSIFMAIRKLKTFSQYYYWRPFRLWKKFVMQQRYQQLSNYLHTHPYFSFPNFFSSILAILTTTSDHILKNHLLPFTLHKKFTLEEFDKTIQNNKEKLYKNFNGFLENIANVLCDLHTAIKNPQRVKVEDSDFQEIKRKNPNIGQLIILEQKIDAEKTRRHQMVDNELSSFSRFIRMIDYMILEALHKSSAECFKIAADNITTEQSAIFQVSISFDEIGQVKFNQTYSDIKKKVKDCFDDSFEVLNNLPRLIDMPQLSEFLLEKVVNGPSFNLIKKNDDSYAENEKIILNHIEKCYNDSLKYCQMYSDYYSIYILSLNWKFDKYLKYRTSKSTEYNLSKLLNDTDIPQPLIFDQSKEEMVQFEIVNQDIIDFKANIEKMSQFHICTIRGCLIIDCRDLKNLLNPIPTNCLTTLHQNLVKLFMKKLEYLNHLFSYCSKHLKNEPASLEQFVDFSEFVKAINEIIPLLNIEITFIDDLKKLIDNSKIDEVNDPVEVKSTRNPLHDKFKSFRDLLKNAKNIQDLIRDKFVVSLNQRLRRQEEILVKYKTMINNYPKTIHQTKSEVLINEMKKLQTEINNSEVEIQALRRCQTVMGVKLHDLLIFEHIKEEINFALNLYLSIKLFNEINDQMTNVPFNNVDIPSFAKNVVDLNENLGHLKQHHHLVIELNSQLERIYPYLNQLEQLSISGMRKRHWLQLVNDYDSQITINDLVKKDVLKQKEKISIITQNAHGESKLETDFANIKQKWLEIQIPLIEQQTKLDDYLLLGDVNLLFNEIIDTQIVLHNMLQIPFAQTIKDDILNLLSILENYAHAIDAWSVFQSNWVILLSLFQQDEIKLMLENQYKKFQLIRRRWISLVRFTQENSTLFHICTFPSLLDMLNENNRMMESILVYVNEYINKKREILPRLNFLSNNEILNLYSQTDFGLFSSYFVKLFMHIKSFEYRIMQINNDKTITAYQDFSRYRIFGLVGDTNETVILNHINVAIDGQLEEWFDKLTNALKDYLKGEVKQSIESISSISLNEWIMNVPTYIALITLYIVFTNDINECFSNLQNNSRVFANYENVLMKKISELCHSLMTPLTHTEINKISTILSLFNYQLALTRSFSEDSQAVKKKWLDQIKVQYNLKTNQIEIDVNNSIYEHGYEFWGSCRPYIQTTKTSQIMRNVLCDNSILFGSILTGKYFLLKEMGCIFGAFVYEVPFLTVNYFIEKILRGTIQTGFWAIFHNIQCCSIENLNFLYESIHECISKKNSKQKTCIVNGYSMNLNENFRFFFTGDRSIFTSAQFPDHLKKFLKPIAMIIPDPKQLAEIKFNTYGFKSSKYIAIKLNMCLTSIPSIFTYLLIKHKIKLMFWIIEKGNDYFRLLLRKSYDIVDYYESSRTAEEYSIVRAIYDFFSPRIYCDQMDLFFNTLYSHFQIFNNLDEFKMKLTTKINTKQEIEQIIQTVLDPTFSDDLRSYLLNQTLLLFDMLETNKMICIYGPPNSGKSLIVEIAKKTIDVVIKNAEENNKFCDLLPIRIFDYFYQSDSVTRIFGEFNSPENDSYTQGKLHSFLINLNSVEKQTSNFLRLNGPLTYEMSQFLNETFCLDKIKLNTLDSFSIHSNFHVIFETNSIENITPSLLLNCCLLPMNIQYNPLNEFNRAVKIHKNYIQSTILDSLKQNFVLFADKVVEFLLKSKKFTNLIKTEYLSKVIELSLIYINNSSITNESNTIYILILAFFNIFKNFDENLETFLLTEFNIDLPTDWVGFNVSDVFWDSYSKPSLETLRFYNNKLIPIDFNYLLTILNGKFCTPQYLPILFNTKLLVNHKKHFLIHGPPKSGKSTLVDFIFHEMNIKKIIIPVSQLSTGQTIQECIQFHLPIITKQYILLNNDVTYALVFDNLPSNNSNAIEFIRMLTTKQIPNSSKKDPKFLENLQIQNFIIVVITNDFWNLPEHFVKDFYQFELKQPTKPTMKFVINRMANKFSICREICSGIENMMIELSDVIPELKVKYLSIMNSLIKFKERNGNTQRDQIKLVLLFLFDLNLYVYHKIDDQKIIKRIRELYQINFVQTYLKDLFETIIEKHELLQANFVFSQNDFELEILNKPIKTVKLFYEQKLNEFNQTNNPMFISFNDSIIHQIVLIHKALNFPGNSIILKHQNNRYNLAKFSSFLCGFSFIEIPYDPLKFYNPESYFDKIKKVIQKPLIECLLLPTKHIVIYLTNDQIPVQLTDLRPFFTLNEIEDLYMKLANTLKIPHDNRVLMNEQLVQLIHNKVHFIISPEDKNIIRFNSNVLFHSNINAPLTVMDSPLSNSNLFDFCDFVEIQLKPNHDVTIENPICELSDSLFLRIHSILCNHSRHLLKTHYDDFITSFSFYSNDLFDKLTKKKISMRNAINFKNFLENEMLNVQNRKSEIGPAIKSLENNDNEYKSNLQKKKNDIIARIQKVDEEDRLNTITLKQLSDEIVPFKGEMITQKVKIDLTRSKINELNEDTFGTIRQYGLNPSPAFKKLIEFYCVFLDYIPQYDPFGKRLLYDQGFLGLIKEKIDPFNVPIKTLLKAKEVFNDNDFTKTDFENISPLCQTLFNWIEAVFKYSNAAQKHDEKNKEYEMKAAEFSQFKQDSIKEKEDLTKKLQSIDHEMKAFQNALVARESMMEEYKVVESRQRILESLHKGFDTLGEKYSLELDNFESSKQKIVGNAILFSVYITYFGYFDNSLQFDLLHEIIDEMKKFDITANYESPEEFFGQYLSLLHAGGWGESDSNPEINQDIRLIKSVPKTPLIIDPDSILLNAFRESKRKVKVTTLINKNFKKILKESLTKGFLLIVEDCNFLSPLLFGILSSYSLKKKNDHILLNSESITNDKDFDLLLFTTKTKVDEIPEDLRQLTTIVNVSENSIKTVRQKVLCCFLNHFDPEMMPRVSSLSLSDQKNNIEKQKYETSTLDSISDIMEVYKNDPQYDCFTDDDRIGHLLQSKECYFAAANVSTDYRMILNELRMTIEPFTKSIDLCMSYWIALSRYMVQVRSCHVFSLTNYLELISTALIISGIHQGIITPQQVKTVDTSIKNQILKWCLPMMSYNEALFYLFISAYQFKVIQEKAKKEDLLIAVDHIASEVNSKCDFTIVDSFNGEPLDQLKFTNVCNIFQFVERYVIDNFGNDYYKYFTYFAIESFMPSNSSTPILIQMHNNCHKAAIKLFEYYYILRSKAQLITLSMCLDKHQLKINFEKFDNAMKTGKVVAISYPSSDLIIASYINEIISMIDKPHPDFRIVLFCSTTDNLPSSVLKKCIRIEFESFPSIKEQMLEIYNHHASVMQSTNSVYLKKQIYSYSLLFSLINYRSFIEPLGFNYEILIVEIRLRDFFIKLRELLENDNNYPITDIREMLLDEELGCGVFDQFDYRKLKAHVNCVASSDLINDGFFFIDSNSAEIDKWTIPNDVSSLNYLHVIDKIPLFPSTDILSINSFIGRPLRNWNMSKWIAAPFLKLSNNLEPKSLVEMLSKTFPDIISVDFKEMKTPLELFLYSEIDLYNQLIQKINYDIHNHNPFVITAYRNQQIPEEWKNLIKTNSYHDLDQFISFLAEKRSFLSMALKKSILYSPVDVRFITSLRGLLVNYLNEIAIQRQMTTDVLSLDFEFSTSDDEVQSSRTNLKLTNLLLIGGNWNFVEKKLIAPNSKTKPIFEMPIVTCVPVKMQAKAQFNFICPLYRSVPSKSLSLDCDKVVVDGVSDNLQWQIPLQSSLVEKALVTSGVCLICQKPDCF